MNVTERLKQCGNPNIIRIRAVLSWESLPSTTDPNKLNHWGNYKDALVQIRPLSIHDSKIHSAIHYVGSVDRLLIDPASHLYHAGAASVNTNRPWGGTIRFNGIIDRNGFNGIIKYRLLVKTMGASDSFFQPVSTTETFRLDDLATLAGAYDDKQVTVDGWYTYNQNLNPGHSIFNVDNLLANWEASSLADGAYTIRFVHTDEIGNEVIADEFSIIVCNKPMTVSLTANTVVDPLSDLDLVIDGGDCHSYTPGEPTINGHLKVVHPYFAKWELRLEPASHTHAATPAPAPVSVSSLTDTGAVETWSLDTAPLDPCGYTVSLTGYSRVIRNNDTNLPAYGPKAVGFAKLP
jgi:hypothetical protein